MSDHSSAPQALHVDAHTVEEMRHHIKRYLIVGVALAIGTALTVWASLINFGSREINIVVALVIASAKGFLVAGFFMHLIFGEEVVYAVLGCTAFFFTGLFFLTLWSMAHGSIIQIR